MNLDQFGLRMQEIINGESDRERLIGSVRGLVGQLTATTDCLGESLEKLLFDREFLNGQTNSIWPNEFSLMRDPGGEFSVSAYVWEPDSTDVVHDHGSWGVVGGVLNRFEERKYRRLDDGSREDHAELAETEHLTIEPGETTFVLPLDEGIHRMENPTEDLAISIHVYGRPVPRGYVRLFDIEQQTVQHAWTPRNLKRLTAVRVLGAVGEPWAGEILEKARRLPLPDPIREECERALARLSEDRPNR